MRYFALSVADLKPGENPEDGYTSTCVGLWCELDDLWDEARSRVLAGELVEIEPGEMSQEEWEALEEVPDDFRPQRAETASE